MHQSDQTRAPAAARAEFRNDINGLRALSVALVVLFHVNARGSGGGFIGVDVFFVISGFLMTRIILGELAGGRFSYWRFMRARAARIWPALGAMILVLLALGTFLLPPSDLAQLADQAGEAVLFWSNQISHDHAGYATQGPDGNWMLHTWSLSVEWQFYMLYPLLLMFVGGLHSHLFKGQHGSLRSGRTFVWALAGLFVASLGVYLVQCSIHPVSAFFLLPARAWEMVGGGLVCVLVPQDARRVSRQRLLASYAGVALILGSALWIGLRHIDPVGLGWLSLGPVVGAMLVLWSAHPGNLFFASAPVQAIGRWSYSIYLWHWPLVVVCAMGDLLDTHRHPAMELVIAASVLLGALSYRLVESRTRSGSGWRGIAKPGLALLAAGAASVAVATTRGLAFRDPASAARPPVSQAHESDYFPDACSNFEKEVRELRNCRIVRRGPRKVLIIGDSLAENLYPWFNERSQVSVDFMTEAECPPVPNFERLQAGFHCLGYAAEAWREAALPEYDTVIVSANWPMVGLVGPRYCHADATGTCSVVDGDRKRKLILAELRAAIRSLIAQGKVVVVLDGRPTTRLNVPQRLDRERFWFGQPRLTIPLNALHEENDWIDPLFAELEATPGFHRLSLRPILCDAQRCKTYDETLQRPIYTDGQHFDPIWMIAHGEIFAPFVQASVPR